MNASQDQTGFLGSAYGYQRAKFQDLDGSQAGTVLERP
jgi:hypothetical protein